MTTKTIHRLADIALPNGRGKRIRLSRAELDAMQLIYPENTETMPDSLQQHPFIIYLLAALEMHFDHIGRAAVVLGDVFIFYSEGDMQAKFAADVSVTLGVSYEDADHDRNYYSWLLGALPNLVLECGSKSTARNDLRRKFRLYASLGIPEYWLLDVPIGENYRFILRGYRLVDGVYVEIEAEENSLAGMVHYRSQEVDLDFCIPEDATRLREGNLRLYDPATGEYLLTTKETARERRAALERAELERNLRLDAEYREAAERERADAAREREAAERERRREAEASAKESDDRASQLEELLRQLGLSHLAPNPKGDNHDREDDTAP